MKMFEVEVKDHSRSTTVWFEVNTVEEVHSTVRDLLAPRLASVAQHAAVLAAPAEKPRRKRGERIHGLDLTRPVDPSTELPAGKEWVHTEIPLAEPSALAPAPAEDKRQELVTVSAPTEVELRKAFLTYAQSKGVDSVKAASALLREFGVPNLSKLGKEQYPAVMARLQELSA